MTKFAMGVLPASFVLRREIRTLQAASKCAVNSVKQKMTELKLRSSVNWQGVLEQKGVKRAGLKQGLHVSSNL